MPDVRVLNELQIKKNGVVATYKLGTVNGYYNSTDGKFYEDSSHTIEIEGLPNLVYADISGNTLYIYKTSTSSFVQVSGSGGGLEYVQTLPSPPNIKDAIYGYYSTEDFIEAVAVDFLDDNEYFDKTSDDYTPKSGIDLTVSFDDITYKALVSLVLNGTNYDATYEDTTTDTFAVGDSFYYKVGSMKFYAGDETNQKLYLIAGASGSGGGMSYQAGIGINITGDVISGDYKGDFGIEINDDKIKTTDFVGTQAQWDALPAADKAKYDFIWITDDTTQVTYKPGHSISDGTTEKTQRDGLVFDGFSVTDDSTNEVTKIAEIPYTAGDGIDITNKEITVTDDISRTWTGTKAEWDAISDKSIYDGWIINITDDAAVGSGPVVDVVEDGNLNAVTSNAVYDAMRATDITSQCTFSNCTLSGGNVFLVGDLVIGNLYITGATQTKNTVLIKFPFNINTNAHFKILAYAYSGTATGSNIAGLLRINGSSYNPDTIYVDNNYDLALSTFYISFTLCKDNS